MIYRTLKPLVRIAYYIFFKKIFFNDKHLPKDKSPIIFAINHPTAFLDPVFFITHFSGAIYSMTRGDVFASPFARWLLEQVKCLPIYRSRDGYANLKNNQYTLERCYQLLNDDKYVVILAEGTSEHEKRMRPIQKGTARMAFGAYEKYGKDSICIMPSCINYTNSHQFRSQIYANYGEPIYIKDYLEVYAENPRKAIKQVTDELSKRMREQIIHIAHPERDEWVNKYLDLKRNELNNPVFPPYSSDLTPFQKEWLLVERINQLSDKQAKGFQERLNAYLLFLQKNNLDDWGVLRPNFYNWRNTCTLLLGLIPFLIGYVGNYLPLRLAKRIADKTAKDIVFHASVRLGAGVLLYVLYLIILTSLAFFFGGLILGTFVFLLPVWGYFALLYQDFYKKWAYAKAVKRLPATIYKKITDLRNLLITEQTVSEQV